VQASAISVSLKLKVCNNGKKVIIGNKSMVNLRPNLPMINALKLAHEIKEQYNEQTADLAQPKDGFSSPRYTACNTVRHATSKPMHSGSTGYSNCH